MGAKMDPAEVISIESRSVAAKTAVDGVEGEQATRERQRKTRPDRPAVWSKEFGAVEDKTDIEDTSWRRNK
jgi:hypothetical protein